MFNEKDRGATFFLGKTSRTRITQPMMGHMMLSWRSHRWSAGPARCRKHTSYPKVTAMTVMSRPKKASSFLRPAGKETAASLPVATSLWKHTGEEQPTVFVQEEEQEGVADGDEDAAPQRDPVRTAHKSYVRSDYCPLCTCSAVQCITSHVWRTFPCILSVSSVYCLCTFYVICVLSVYFLCTLCILCVICEFSV